MAESKTQGDGKSLAELIALYKQLSTISAALFAPLAKTYVGTLVAHREAVTNAEVVNLALRKMAYEAGEIMVARNPPTDKPIGKFEQDKEGQLPDFSLAQVAATALAYIKYRDEQAAKKQQQAVAKATPQVEVLAAATSVRQLRAAARVQAYQVMPTPVSSPTVRMTGGCGCGGSTSSTGTGGCGCGGGCGGTTTNPPPQAVPCYDPCAGGLVAVPPASEVCGCSCASCQTQPPANCDDMCSISCETKLRLRDCIKQLICDLLKYIETHWIQATPDSPAAILQKFLHCLVDAICPPAPPPCLPPGSPLPCLPCSYAVENS